MSGNGKSLHSAAPIKAEVKRYQALCGAIGRLSKQLERVSDPQLRSGLRVYLRSIEGKTLFNTLFIYSCAFF